MLPTSHAVRRLALGVAIAVSACRAEAPAEHGAGPQAPPAAASPAGAGAAAGPVDAAAQQEVEHDAPDLQGALAAAIRWGVVAPEAGDSTWEVDPFVVAWLVAAVQENGDRWLTPYEASGADGVEVAGWQVRVPEGSPLAALGLEDGDVIERVAEVPATDVERVQAAVAIADNQIRLAIHRKDFSLTLAYRLETDLGWSRMQADLSGGEPPPLRANGVVALDASRLPSRYPGANLPKRAGSDPPSSGTPSKPSSGTPSKPSSGTPSKPSSGTPSKPSSSGADKVRCSGSTCVVERAYFNEMVGSPSRLQSQATIVPAIANDVHSGYKLKSVKSGSAVHAMGFRSGDKITHVNGYDLTDDAQALALYLGVGSTKSFKVRYVRGDAARTKTIRVE